MGFNRLTKSVLNISGLPDRVQNQATTLKALFDQAGVDIKEALNALMTELETSTSASNIGADVSTVATKTVQAILTAYEEAIADRYTKLEAGTLVLEETNNLVADVDVNLTTGVITVTKKDGTIETFDTALEKVPAKFEIVESNGKYALKITNLDGTSTQTDITTLMNIYTFNNSDTINFEVTGEGNEKAVVATIKDNSIGLEKLSLTVVSTIEGYMNSAKDSATAAKTSETNARTSEINAANSANTAVNSATTATQKANAAAESAAQAQKWAEQAGGAAGDLSGYYTKAETDAKIEEAIEGIEIPEGEGSIPKFVGTEENPIDFSNLFEGIGNATDGWYKGGKRGQCILSGYMKTMNQNWQEVEPKLVSEVFKGYDEVLVSYTYIGADEYAQIVLSSQENVLDISDAGLGTISMIYIYAGFPASGFVENSEVAANVLTEDDALTLDNTTEYTPTADYHPATKKYVDDTAATVVVFENSILTTNWVTDTQNWTDGSTRTIYYYDMPVLGMLETDRPHITPVYTAFTEFNEPIEEAYNKLTRALASADMLRVYASEIPTTEIPIQIEVIR